MSALSSLKRLLSREVSILVIPHTDWAPWKMRFSVPFVLFLCAMWTGLTVWAGYVVGRHVDYWITKADNEMLKARVAYFANEVDRSRDFLKLARNTDRQLRVLLGMQSRRAILESEEGLGGPLSEDRFNLKKILEGKPMDISQALIHRRAKEVQDESQMRLASFQEIAWYIANQRSLFQSTPNIWPAEGRITSSFGYRFSPFRNGEGENAEFHSGIDIANQPDTKVFATADGVVRLARFSSGYGMMILVDHGYGYSTLYGHTSRLLAREGEFVRRGQPIAYMGTTGRSTGDHLHYEVWIGGRPVNPLKFLKVGGRGGGS